MPMSSIYVEQCLETDWLGLGIQLGCGVLFSHSGSSGLIFCTPQSQVRWQMPATHSLWRLRQEGQTFRAILNHTKSSRPFELHEALLQNTKQAKEIANSYFQKQYLHQHLTFQSGWAYFSWSIPGNSVPSKQRWTSIPDFQMFSLGACIHVPSSTVRSLSPPLSLYVCKYAYICMYMHIYKTIHRYRIVLLQRATNLYLYNIYAFLLQ